MVTTPASQPASQTAKIVRFHQLGAAAVLELEELPLPQPAAGEVRLRVKATGLNRAEISFREGWYLVPPTLPSKLGYEASGMKPLESSQPWAPTSIRCGAARLPAPSPASPPTRTASTAKSPSSLASARAESPATLS
jgi:hypothetical protein